MAGVVALRTALALPLAAVATGPSVVAGAGSLVVAVGVWLAGYAVGCAWASAGIVCRDIPKIAYVETRRVCGTVVPSPTCLAYT